MAELPTIFIVLVAAGGPIVIFFTIRFLLWPRPIPGILHNPITSFWGDAAEFEAARVKKGAFTTYYLEPHAEKLGPIYQVILGPFGNIVVLSDAQEIEDLLVRRARSVDASPLSIGSTSGIIKYSQISMKAAEYRHKKHRRLLGPSMAPRYLKSMTPRITSNIECLVRFWQEKMQVVERSGGKCFASEVDLQFCTMDTIGEIVFGENFDCIQGAEGMLNEKVPLVDQHGGATLPHVRGSRLKEALKYLDHVVSGSMHLAMWMKPIYFWYVKLGRRWKSKYGAVSAFIHSRIKNARERVQLLKARGGSLDEADCIVDMVMEREGREDPERWNDVELVDELLGLVIAGHDTGSSALAFGLKHISRDPHIQYKLRNELLSKLDSPIGRPLTYNEVTSENLPYLEAVVAEILRLAGVGGMTTRILLEDEVILGHPVPKDTVLFFLNGYASYATTDGAAEERARSLDPIRAKASVDRGLAKGCWSASDANLFKPERWLVEETAEDGSKTTKFSSQQGVAIPFGLGPKSCFGMKLAILEMKLFVATLSLAFFFDRVPSALDDDEFKETFIRHPRQAYVALKDWDDVPYKL